MKKVTRWILPLIVALSVGVPVLGSYIVPDGAVTTSKLAANAVTAAKIANGAITTTQISASAGITGSQIAAATITGTQVAAGTITNTNLAAPIYAVSSSSGTSYSTSSGVFTTVVSVSATLDGLFPVIAMVVPDGTGNPTSLTCNAGSEYRILRDGATTVGVGLLLSGSNSIVVYDPGAIGLSPGSHSYAFQVLSGSSTLTVHNFVLAVQER